MLSTQLLIVREEMNFDLKYRIENNIQIHSKKVIISQFVIGHTIYNNYTL